MLKLVVVHTLNPLRRNGAFLQVRRTIQSMLLQYKFGSPERASLEQALAAVTGRESGVPIVIGIEQIFSGDEQQQIMPHNHRRTLVKYYYCNRQHIEKAIEQALQTQGEWAASSVAKRVEIWLKCADILEKEDRHKLNAATMIGQAKPHQLADEDTCRLIESLRSNASLLLEKSQRKLESKNPKQLYPLLQLRPLEGFVAAIAPFPLTSMSANLAFLPALVGNCVLWKPSDSCVLSSYICFEAMLKAGLPQGVVNFVPANPKLFVRTLSDSPHLAGINFAGSDKHFRAIWHEVSIHIRSFKSIPRLVGECGTKNFHFVHQTADVNVVAEATVHSAFAYSGQLSAGCARLYVPESMWPELNCGLQHRLAELKVGDPCDFAAFTSAVINERAYERINSYIEYAKKSSSVDLMCGGDSCNTLGYFIEPTIVLCKDPKDRLMTDDITGPILSVYVYKDQAVDEALDLITKTSIYSYTGSIFASDDKVICGALKKLRSTVSNMYINEGCTGNIDGHVQFGGHRHSGTNDQTGTPWGMLRWCAPQLIEETLPEVQAFEEDS